MTTSDEILAAAQALSEEERLLIVDTLLRTLQAPDPAVDAAWAPIVKKRIEEIDRGEVELITGEEVLAEAQHLLSNR